MSDEPVTPPSPAPDAPDDAPASPARNYETFWLVVRFALLMLILVLMAAIVVWVLLPLADRVLNPPPLPTLLPPDRV